MEDILTETITETVVETTADNLFESIKNTNFGINKYTCSEKTKRPSKVKIDDKTIEERNCKQKKLYITLDNINEIFSNNEKYPVCYDFIFNYIQGKVTKYFNGIDYDRKKELSYDCINYLYSVLKRKLLNSMTEENTNPTLFFYLSQFFRYIDLLVFSMTYFNNMDRKHFVREQENFNNDDLLRGFENFDKFNEFGQLEIPTDNSERIKQCIEQNKKLDSVEKQVLLKIYSKCYSKFGMSKLSKKETQVLNILQLRMEYEPDLLDDLEEILNGKRQSIED